MGVIIFINSDHVRVFSLLFDCYGKEHVFFYELVKISQQISSRELIPEEVL